MNKKIKISSIIIFALLITIICYLTITVENQEQVEIQSILLEGAKHIDNTEYLKYAKLDDRTQYSFLSLNIIRDRLIKHPYINNVNIKINSNGVVNIVLKEKLFVAILLNDTKKYFLTSNFEMVPLFQVTKESNYPLLMNVRNVNKAKPFSYLNKNKDVKVCYKMIMAMKTSENDLLNKLSEINLRNGGDIILTMSNLDYPLIIGRTQEVNKVISLSKIWQHISNKKISNVIEYLDLRFADNIYIGTKEPINNEES